MASGKKQRKFGVKGSGGKKTLAAIPISLESMRSVVVGAKDSAGAGFRTISEKKRNFGVKNPVPRGIPGVSGRMESCPEGCPGEYIEGMWIHSKECRWSAVLWRQHGKTEKDWTCPYNCPPQEIPSGWTHQWECAFWDRTGRTPFDHRAPHRTEKVEAAQGRSKSAGRVGGSDSQSGQHSESWQVKRAREKEEAKIFADNLPFFEEDDNDLPF